MRVSSCHRREKKRKKGNNKKKKKKRGKSPASVRKPMCGVCLSLPLKHEIITLIGLNNISVLVSVTGYTTCIGRKCRARKTKQTRMDLISIAFTAGIGPRHAGAEVLLCLLCLFGRLRWTIDCVTYIST